MKAVKGSDVMGESPSCTFFTVTRQKKTLFFLQVPKPFSVTAALMLLLSSFPLHHCSKMRRFQPYVASITAPRLYQVQNIIESLIAAALFDFHCIHCHGAPGGCLSHLLSASEVTAQDFFKVPLFVLQLLINCFFVFFFLTKNVKLRYCRQWHTAMEV